MKVDFRKIQVKDIDGNVNEADISKMFGNMLYMQGQDIEECELGRDIYHNGEVELNEKMAAAVKRFAGNYPYLMRSSIEEMLK